MKKIELCEIELEVPEDLFDFLVEFGLEKIKEDKKELANYAMNIILKEKIDELKSKNII